MKREAEMLLFFVHLSSRVSFLKYVNSLLSRSLSFCKEFTNENSSGVSDEEIVIVLGEGSSVKP